MKILYFDQLESTNNYCKLLDLNSVEEFTLICARRQTAGIGQQGNRWESEPYKNLTFSLILKPTFLAAADQYQLTMALALAITDLLDSELHRNDITIKWPNDIYVGDRKICGTLVSCQLHNAYLANAICGVGLNVNQASFPSWVPNPVSMLQLDNRLRDLDALLPQLAQMIGLRYRSLRVGNPSALRHSYLGRLYRIGTLAAYEYKGTTLEATITGVDHYGHLLLLTPDGATLSCNLKEVRFLP